jgi:hypothetical protein
MDSMSTLKELPNFKNEDEEREFWATHSFLDYLDLSKVQRVSPPVPKSNADISVQLPKPMSEQIERLSQIEHVALQDIIRQLLADGLRQRGIQPGM